MSKKSRLSRIVTWTVIGVLAILALKIVLRLLGVLLGLAGLVFGVASFVLFTVGPILLLGWLVLKGWNAYVRSPRGESAI